MNAVFFGIILVSVLVAGYRELTWDAADAAAAGSMPGHSDVMGGVLVVKTSELADRLREERFYSGSRAGSVGTTGCFSFYPSKNLGAWGDGGAITTSDTALRDRLLGLRNWGETRKYHHEIRGYNARLDAVQAAVLGVKLPRLEQSNRRRREAAAFYDRNLKEGLPRPGLEGVFHLYVIRVANRDRLREQLAETGIQTGMHYPVPLHLQPCFEELGHSVGEFPVAERIASQLLSLPIYPQIGKRQLSHVVEQVNRLADAP